MDDEVNIPHATDDQVKSATSLLKRVDLRDFSVFQFANPGILLTFDSSCICCFSFSEKVLLFYLKNPVVTGNLYPLLIKEF